MTRSAAMLLALLLATPAVGAPVKMAGFLRTRVSESIRPVGSNEWSFNIMMLAPEGEYVKAGDVVARFEGQNLKERLTEAKNRQAEDRVKNEGKIGDLRATIEGLEKQLAQDEGELALLAAGVASGASSASVEWIQSARDRLIEQQDIGARTLKLKIARDKLARKRVLLENTLKASAKAEDVNKQIIAGFEDGQKMGERKATTAGIVVYKRTPWERRKVRVGGAAYRGAEVLAVVDDKSLFVEGFLKEEDWRSVKVGQASIVTILGRRELKVPAKVLKVSAIVLKASEWDRALPESHPLFQTRVFKVELALSEVPDEAKPDGEVEIELAVPPP